MVYGGLGPCTPCQLRGPTSCFDLIALCLLKLHIQCGEPSTTIKSDCICIKQATFANSVVYATVRISSYITELISWKETMIYPSSSVASNTLYRRLTYSYYMLQSNQHQQGLKCPNELLTESTMLPLTFVPSRHRTNSTLVLTRFLNL